MSDLIFGFTPEQWEAAKAEARRAMIEHASRRGMITYSDLVKKIHAAKLQAHDVRLFHLLGEISKEENAAGRGMLSVVVVHRVGDMEPGSGFYELARDLGRDVTDPTKCWINELHRVHAECDRRS